MKTISGTVISSKPISLSKATSILSTFVAADTGASQAIGAYLRRSLASFKELKQLHKELKADPSERKKKKRSRSEIADDVGENTINVEASQETEPKRKKHKR